VMAWVLSGRYRFPEAAEPGDATWDREAPTQCPRTLDDWRWTSRLHNATKGRATLKYEWDKETSVGARYELHREGKATPIGGLQCEPPLRPTDRRAIWSTGANGAKKQVLSDRFVYRVTTAEPSIMGVEAAKTVTLKLARRQASIEVYVLTSMPAAAGTRAKDYEKDEKLPHSSVGHGLLDGTKPDPAFDKNCEGGEDDEVQMEVDRLPDWLKRAFSPEGSPRCQDGRLGPRSSLDTFCPGWDVS
jgi:hypothetical protein